MVELHPSKVVVVSSSLIARSFLMFSTAHVAQLVERILGKDEVHGFESRRGLFIVANCANLGSTTITETLFIQERVSEHVEGEI